MTNDEARRNVEIPLTKTTRAELSSEDHFGHSSFISHWSFVIRHFPHV